MDICWWVGVGREGKGNTKLTPRYLPSTSRGATDAISGDGAWKNPHPELLSPAVPFDTKRMCQVDSWLGGGSQLGHRFGSICRALRNSSGEAFQLLGKSFSKHSSDYINTLASNSAKCKVLSHST